MKTKLQEILTLIGQNDYLYYTRKAFVYFSEWLAYLFALIFTFLGFYLTGYLSSEFNIAEKISEENAQSEANENAGLIKYSILIFCLLIALVYFIYARRMRANRHFRMRVKSAERKLKVLVDDFDVVMNEMN